jgi:hypothetical protein
MNAQVEVRSQPRHSAGPLGYLLALAVAVLLLYVMTMAFTGVACLWLALPAVLVALPLWRYQTDRILFERRAILASVATPTGRLWKWFWRGRVATSLQVIVALVLAMVLLGMLSPLQPLHWAILGADALLIALLIGPVRRMLAGQVREGYIGLVARRWPLTAVNVALLITGFVVVDYAIVGWPDTRLVPWPAVAEASFEGARSSVTCPVAGVLLGIAETVTALSRHAASLAIPTLPSGSIRVLAWVLFLAWTGIGAFLFTRFLLGVVALIDRVGSTEAGADDRTTRAFVYTILALAVPTLYATIKYAEWQSTPVDLTEIPVTATPVDDPCRAFQFDTATLSDTLNAEVGRARSSTHVLAEERIDAALEHAFGEAERGVERYLDWYYSMLGDYSRLAAVATGDIDQMMSEKLQTYVLEETGFASILESASSSLEQETMLKMEQAADAAKVRIGTEIRQSPCPVPSVDLSSLVNLRPDIVRATVATTAGGGVAAKFLVAKPAAAMAGKLAAKTTVKAAGKVLAKAAVKKGATAAATFAAGTSATAVCSFLGPFAPVCGIGAGVLTWVAVDKVVLEIDERVNREEMRAELLAGLGEQRAEIRAQLVTLHQGLADLYASEINAQIGKVFIPARDGR